MLNSIQVVLVETSHPGNIGSVARAMKTMGLQHLVLVNPKKFPDVEATALASGAEDVLNHAQICETFDEAIADCQYVYGCTARPRDLNWPMYSPRQWVDVVEKLTGKIALVFGRERIGLTNDELWRCHAGLMIPTSLEYRSLNLAQAVQILAYELQVKFGEEFHLPASSADAQVDMQAMENYYQHLEKVLIDIDFMRADEPKRLMPKLRRLFNRVEIQCSEMNILRGVLTQIQKKIRNES
ncbi:MAG: RNA methyltransferase [Gammaproteobacteria bacterium]|nr:RNA methyltransferase [Gammaproteobacteria bacterium]